MILGYVLFTGTLSGGKKILLLRISFVRTFSHKEVDVSCLVFFVVGSPVSFTQDLARGHQILLSPIYCTVVQRRPEQHPKSKDKGTEKGRRRYVFSYHTVVVARMS